MTKTREKKKDILQKNNDITLVDSFQKERFL